MELQRMTNASYNSSDEDDEVLLPGFRFHPTDEELVGFYLRRKVEKKPISIELIKHIDIYKYDPWDLPKISAVGDQECYFFCMRERKYRNSIRPNRVTGSGFWKATGIDKPIYSAGENHGCIGLKKSLVYYQGSAGKGTKTDWMMHEFRLPANKATNPSNAKSNTHEAEIWTLCRIFKRNVPHRKDSSGSQDTPSTQSLTDSSSKTCSFESDGMDKGKTYEVSGTKENESRQEHNHHYEKNQSFEGQLSLATQAPLAEPYVSLLNLNGNEFLTDGIWDELRPIVDFAFDSSRSTAWL